VNDTTGFTPTPEAHVERFATATALLETAGPFLAEREAEHNPMFGICANLKADPGFRSHPAPRGGQAGRPRDGGRLMTPPWNVVLSCTDDPGATAALAADLVAAVSVPGVTGRSTRHEPSRRPGAARTAWSARSRSPNGSTGLNGSCLHAGSRVTCGWRRSTTATS
jgi:hypothetical protein